MRLKSKYLKKLMAFAILIPVGMTGCTRASQRVNPDQEILTPDFTEAETEAVTEEVPEAYSEDMVLEEPVEDYGDYIEFSLMDYWESDYEYMEDTGENVLFSKAAYTMIDIQDQEYGELRNAINSYCTEARDSILDSHKSNGEYAREEYAEGYFNGTYSDEASLSVTRADSKLFCVRSVYYSYYGGAHGYTFYSGHAFDSATGDELGWQDFFTDTSDVVNIICNALRDEYDTEGFWENYEEVVANYVSGTDGEYDYSLPFTVGNDGITFYFNAYDLACYAAGMQEVTIRYSEYPDILKSEYFENPNADYVEKISTYNFMKDIDRDGKNENIYSYTNEWDNGGDYLTTLTVALNSNETTIDAYGYNPHYYYVSMQGKSYLYAAISSENDWCTVYVFDLNKDTPVYVDKFEGHIDNIYNPHCFRIDKRTDMLSTIGIYAYAKVGENGMPLYLTDYYYVLSTMNLTSTVELTGEIINEQTGLPTGKQKTVSAGSTYTFVRTDGETYVDMRINDRELMRFNVGKSWPQTINGMDAGECFEMLFYAG